MRIGRGMENTTKPIVAFRKFTKAYTSPLSKSWTHHYYISMSINATLMQGLGTHQEREYSVTIIQIINND